jgi:archaellum component FlaC
MNKALHVFVYLFLALAGAGLYFESQLNAQRELLTRRSRLQEDYFVKLAATIEREDADKTVVAEINKDVSPVEAKIVDTPETENVLEDYKAYLETDGFKTYEWENQPTRAQLRAIYVLDEEGKPQMDGELPLMRGPGTEDELLSKLLSSSQAQQAKLNTTRAELKVLRGKLDDTVNELNKLKPEARQDKVTIVEKNEKITKLEGEKSELENQIVKIKSQIDDLNAEITSLKDEVVTAKDETELAKEELEKAQKTIEQLKNLMKDLVAAGNSGAKTGAGMAVSSIPAGDKGRIVEADNVNMFAIVELSDEAMKELKNNDPNRPMPLMEFGVKRPGYQGEAGEFVGRVRLRQEVPGKNYVICDILSNWEQDKLQFNDVIFAD